MRILTLSDQPTDHGRKQGTSAQLPNSKVLSRGGCDLNRTVVPLPSIKLICQPWPYDFSRRHFSLTPRAMKSFSAKKISCQCDS